MLKLALIMPATLTLADYRQCSSLVKWLARADMSITTYDTRQTLLGSLFNFPVQQHPLPMAALTAIDDGLKVQPGDWWMRADPVELQADQATVYLVGHEQLQLTTAEATALVNDINAFLAKDGLTLFAPHPQRWYLKLRTNPQLTTLAPAGLGKPITGYLQQGTSAAYWRRLFSELQMLLHQHPINLQRTQAAKPIINGLWFWGEGYLPVVTTKSVWDNVCSDSAVERGLATWQGIPLTAMPATFADGQFVLAGNHLLIMDSLPATELSSFVNVWFMPLINAIKKQQITELTLYLDQQHRLQFNQGNVKKWWRRRYRF